MDSQDTELEQARLDIAALQQIIYGFMGSQLVGPQLVKSHKDLLPLIMSSRTVNTDNNTRIQVRVRTTQTAGKDVPDASWKIVTEYDTGGIPQPIVVNNLTLATPENMAINVGLSVAAEPTPNPVVTFAIVNPPKNGTLGPISSGIVSYTPKQDYQGIDIFTYNASDQTGLVSAPGTVSITVGTPPANVMGTMNVINHSTQVTDAQVQAWTTGIQQQCNTDVAKAWGGTVNLVWIPNTQAPAAGNWVAGIFDTADQAGALGYHEVGPNGEPLAKIFITVSKQAGVDPATVLSHEVIESIGDPNTNTLVKNCQDVNGKACTMFQELCDAVEDNVYQVGGINVSDFITKNWFVANSTGPYDQLNATTKPFQLLPGGYSEVSYDGGRTWTQEVLAMKGKMAMYREMAGEASRWTKYKKPMSERKRSTYKTS